MRTYPPASDETQSLQGRYGATCRHHPESEAADELRRDLAASRLADHARHVAENAPRLTTAQVDRLSVILRGGRA